jgi:hypothetical protein
MASLTKAVKFFPVVSALLLLLLIVQESLQKGCWIVTLTLVEFELSMTVSMTRFTVIEDNNDLYSVLGPTVISDKLFLGLQSFLSRGFLPLRLPMWNFIYQESRRDIYVERDADYAGPVGIRCGKGGADVGSDADWARPLCVRCGKLLADVA